MKQPSEDLPDWESQRMKIIGLGESSIRKSYYPELQQRLRELEQKNEELQASNEELTATEEELRHQYEELQMSQNALDQARKKLQFLNIVTFEDIQNAVFTLSGYLELSRSNLTEEQYNPFLNEEQTLVHKITHALIFAKNYQDLGINPPKWQNLNRVFLFAISHLDLSYITRDVRLENLEIYADPLLEKVFFNLMENVIKHTNTVSTIRLWYQEQEKNMKIYIEDDGTGIREELKEEIFNRGYGQKKGIGLFLAREILSITGITITETGEYQHGARFELTVPIGIYRFPIGDHPEQG